MEGVYTNLFEDATFLCGRKFAQAEVGHRRFILIDESPSLVILAGAYLIKCQYSDGLSIG
jgi:hypothetical protein